jgi:endoglucanase
MPTARRRLVALAALTLALTGGTVGHQLADAGQRTAPASHRTAIADTAVAPTAHRSHRPGTRPTSGPTSAGPSSPTASSSATSPTATSPAAPSSATTGPATGMSSSTPTGTTSAGTTSAAAAAPAPAAGTGAAGNPLAGLTLYGPNSAAAQAAASGGFSAADSALLSQLASAPTALWLGSWSGDVTQTVRDAVTAAQASGGVPILVAYDVPDTDCGGYSAGGASSPAAYAEWIRGLAAGIGTARAIVVVEPDALAQLCGDPAQRYAMLSAAVDVLEANPGTYTYLDAGNSAWVPAAEMAQRLRAAGVTHADGFSLNVSNFQTTTDSVAYGQALSAALGGAHFVVDTSRNGNGPGTDWCNPSGRAAGARPTTSTGRAGVDAFLWVKRPGESDGTCNGGPAAGVFWPAYALGLLRAG